MYALLYSSLVIDQHGCGAEAEASAPGLRRSAMSTIREDSRRNPDEDTRLVQSSFYSRFPRRCTFIACHGYSLPDARDRLGLEGSDCIGVLEL